jgi:hypothetical protein
MKKLKATKKLNKCFEEILDSLNINYTEPDSDGYVELSFDISYGGSYVMTFNVDSIKEDIEDYEFDEDDYVYTWLQAKFSGTSGVPSASELVEAADDIEQKIDELQDRFSEI